MDIFNDAYLLFARYPERALRDAEPNDCSANDGLAAELSEALVGRPIRSLTGADLDRYFLHAVAHVGDADDFRHYLPRILELVNAGELSGSLLLSHLALAEIRSWPLEERLLLLRFFQTYPRALGSMGTIELAQEILGAA